MNAVSISVDSIRTDGGTQLRVQENSNTIQQYTDSLAAQIELPPVDVFFDGTDHWLVDGFHRLAAHKKIGQDTILCHLHEGTLSDAMLFACNSNWNHGLNLSDKDKENIVLAYFKIPGKETKSNNAASKEIPASVPFIKKVREKAGIKPSPSAHVGRGSRKNLNGLNNPVMDGKNLNRLNKSTPQTDPGKTVNVDLPVDDIEALGVVLLQHFEPKHLKACMEYLGIL